MSKFGALFAVIALFLAADSAVLAAVNDPVPLPRPNPAAATVTATSTATTETPNQKKSVFQKLFGKKKKGPNRPSPFTQSQQSMLANISNYFNSFNTMQGEFVQVGPRGGQSEGVFVISKPGKIRFHYKPPVRLDVISNGSSVAILDNRAQTQDLYPLSKTPLRHLLAKTTDLTSASIVDGIREEADLISVVIEEKSALIKGTLTLIFDRETFELRQWIVTDGQGLNTSVAIFNTVTGIRPDPNLFKIYTNLGKSRR